MIWSFALTQLPDTSNTLLLICQDGASRNRYCSTINSTGVAILCVSTLMDFFKKETYRSLCGIMVDMPTYIRSSDEEKRLLTDLVALFPALRLKYHVPTGEIRSLPFGTAYPGNMPLPEFISQFCTTFSPRKVRTCERSQQHLPVTLSTGQSSEQIAGIRIVTANISQGGCFLVSYSPLVVADKGWLVFKELKDPTPVPVEVRSVRLWGEFRTLPGMGIKFLSLTRSQKIEIGRFGGHCLMLDDE
jgi:hypothetical protein